MWRFADSGIAVPGARDLTLSERFRPKTVLAEDGESIERVIVSGDDIRQEPELLGWCLEHGARLQNAYGKVTEVLVPYELWQQHDHVPDAIYAPEHSPKEGERELAKAERRCREAERELEGAAEARAEVLRRYAPEMTRQEAREITGLSIGRIQQLIGKNQKLPGAQNAVLKLIGPGAGNTISVLRQRAARRGVPSGHEHLSRRLRELVNEGLVERKGEKFLLTKEGRNALTESKDDGPPPG